MADPLSPPLTVEAARQRLIVNVAGYTACEFVHAEQLRHDDVAECFTADLDALIAAVRTERDNPAKRSWPGTICLLNDQPNEVRLGPPPHHFSPWISANIEAQPPMVQVLAVRITEEGTP